ncbi:MAG TPA: hypothetical protein VE261_04245, partial [Gaiellaceae bacterium]|nr:hypothetical protein [Gaiellaceae bacterium]
MLDAWLQDIESLEAISADDGTRTIFLRMAAMSQAGRVPILLAEIERDGELDETTKTQLSELAQDHLFLHAIDEYTR